MTTTITPSATRPPALTLDERLALTGLAMDDRLDTAGVAVSVRTAHIDTEITMPPQTATPYRTPIAALLHRARIRIQTDGWCRTALYDNTGAVCPIRAIRLEASSRGQADDAAFLLLEAVRRQWQADTIPSWNAQQDTVAPVLIAFGRAAELAHARNL
ncbi:DUF6197 family protein [Streptomyces griseofuscus]|uniref:Uncharacterized protein n=1 Tax=Streptomyces griseofuscus TaxID=146922 RepID=A0A426RZ10_9ACTN|nr:hypothetical protein [Streptomyces griseofuscus]RRQ81546.1 hypothetical protein CQW44_30560 [Streptomyces griseofuscus]